METKPNEFQLLFDFMKRIVSLYAEVGLISLSTFLPISSLGQASWSALRFGSQPGEEVFHLSMDVGSNISTLPGLPQQQPILGTNIGFGTYFKLNNKWAFTPELKLISNRGAADVKSIYNDVAIQNPKSNIVTNYIDIPLLIQYNISDQLNIATGAQISFLTYASQITTGTLASGQPVTVSYDIKSLMHKEGFMVPVQLGYTSRPSGIGLKLRYNIGIMEAFTATSIAESKNSTFQIIASLPFIKKVRSGF